MQRVVITGGGSGIGRHLAGRFVARGDRVAICDRDPAAVAATADALPEAMAHCADAADEAQMEAFLAAVEERLGGVDVMCANVGTGGPAGRVDDLDYDAWMECVRVNLGGAFLACRWAARKMRPQGAGSIILTASTAGQFGYPFRSPYAAAKWGIVGLTRTLAMELGPDGIRVNAICPGAVEGDRMDRVVSAEAAARGISEEEVRALYVRGVSMRSWVTVEDVAETVLFLASPAARRISGQILAIDGHTETLQP